MPSDVVQQIFSSLSMRDICNRAVHKRVVDDDMPPIMPALGAAKHCKCYCESGKLSAIC
jgi:hypothetical protein